MPRRYSTPHRRLEITLPEPLILEVELYLKRDPRTGKVAFGEWSNLFRRLLRADLNAKAGDTNVPD